MSQYYDDPDPRDRRSFLGPVLAVLLVAVIAAVGITTYDRWSGWARELISLTGLNLGGSAGRSSITADAATPANSGVPQTRTRIGDWILACDVAVPSHCSITQSLRYPEAVPMDATMVVQTDASGAVALWTIPTGILINRGMGLDVGDGKPKMIPYESCDARSCDVRAKLTPDFIEALKKVPRLSSIITLKGGKTYTFEFSTKGLPEALGRINGA